MLALSFDANQRALNVSIVRTLPILTTNRNFELPRVKSINTSGHKFGLVYAGVGWIIWRDESFLPKHLIFELHYLGGTEESYTLNFSRPGAQIIAQYYNLIHLGFDGFRAIMENCLSNARLLSKSLEATGWCKYFRRLYLLF